MIPFIRGGGLEPPPTGSKPVSLPLADPRVRSAGVEPAYPVWKTGASAARPRTRFVSFRSKGSRGGIRTPMLPINSRARYRFPPPWNLVDVPAIRSTQRESNPHIRHGKAVGCRYIMGTTCRHRIVKESESTGWDSNPRRRITGAVSSPLDHQCVFRVGPEGFEPSPARLRAGCAAVNTWVPHQWGRRDSNPRCAN